MLFVVAVALLLMFCPFLSIVLVLNNYRKNHYYDTTTTKTRIFSRISVRLSSELERKCTIVLFCSHTLLLSLAFSLSEYILNISLIISFSLSLFSGCVRLHPSRSLSRLQSKTPLNCNANYKLKISPFVVLLRLSLRLALTFNHRRALPRSGFDFDLIVCVLVCSLNRHR